jgi:hydrogenase/urease accessory protein HupE
MHLASSLMGFSLDFILSTTSLHGIEMAVGYFMRNRVNLFVRMRGFGIAATGGGLVLNFL